MPRASHSTRKAENRALSRYKVTGPRRTVLSLFRVLFAAALTLGEMFIRPRYARMRIIARIRINILVVLFAAWQKGGQLEVPNEQ